MRRTAADFAREAPKDGPYELQAGNRWLKPLPVSDMTLDQQKDRARLLGVWAAAANGDGQFPTRADGTPELEPSEHLLRFRFGALKWEDGKGGALGRFAPDDNQDWAAFKRHWVDKLPWEQVASAMREVDQYYDPTPATEQEAEDLTGDPDGDAAGKSPSDSG